MAKFKVSDIIKYNDNYYTIIEIHQKALCYGIVPLKGFVNSAAKDFVTYTDRGIFFWNVTWTDIHCSLAPESVRLLYEH